MKPVLLIDFGSTYTKVTAVDVESERLLGTADAYTTVQTDVGEGLANALTRLREKIGPVEFTARYACSSAAGGLRMISSGLVPELTAEAARQASLGAGAKVLKVYSFQLTEDDLDEIFDCAQRFVADCGLLDKPEKESFRKVLDSIRVIRADGKIVSMARIAPATGDDLRLVLVYTRDEYRGRGYARKVVNSAKNEILASGKRATLNVDRKNPVSYHLYLSLGFERVFSQGEFRRVE